MQIQFLKRPVYKWNTVRLEQNLRRIILKLSIHVIVFTMHVFISVKISCWMLIFNIGWLMGWLVMICKIPPKKESFSPNLKLFNTRMPPQKSGANKDNANPSATKENHEKNTDEGLGADLEAIGTSMLKVVFWNQTAFRLQTFHSTLFGWFIFCWIKEGGIWVQWAKTKHSQICIKIFQNCT